MLRGKHPEVAARLRKLFEEFRVRLGPEAVDDQRDVYARAAASGQRVAHRLPVASLAKM